MELRVPGEYYSSLLLLILPFIFQLVILKVRRNRSSHIRPPPGPTHLPILGHLHLIDRNLPHRSLYLLSAKHGPIMQLQLGLKTAVVVSSARIAAEVFKSHDHVFSRRPSLISNKILTYDFFDVAFSPHNGDSWKEMRKVLFRELLCVKMVQSFRSIREAEVERMISSICSFPPSQPINLKEIMITLTNNVACIADFGRSYLEGSEEEKRKVLGMIADGMYLLSRFFLEDFLPWMWWIDVAGGLYAKLRKSFGELDKFYERVIQEHLQPERGKREHEDFIDVFLQAQKEDFHFTREHIKGVMMDIVFGATDTSAAVVSWGMAELIRSPQAMKKCQEGVRRIAGKKGKVEEDDLTQLPYLKAVVKESFRLHPPGPLLVPRECTQQCKVAGYDILPGTILMFSSWAIGRDPEAWDNPQEFLPERFLNSSIDFKGHDFGLIPFGSGRRGCPGIHFAAATIEIVLANLLYHFDWELPAGMRVEDVDLTEASGLVTLPKSIMLVPTKHHN